MELSPLKTFLTIAEEGNLTRAARRLHLTQPAVSAQLARLEEELGTALFDREPRGMRLTEGGAVFRDYVLEAVATLEAGQSALEGLQGLIRGTLRIGGGATAVTCLLPPVLTDFHRAHPGIRLFVQEQGSAAVVAGVRAGDLDLGVVTIGGEVDRLVVEPWVEDELLLICPPGAAAAEGFRWSELAEVPLVLFQAGTAVRAVLDAHLSQAGVVPRIAMELRSVQAIRQMVEQGLGAGFVSRHALPSGIGLRCLDGPVVRQLGIVTRGERSLPPAARAFRACLLRSS